MRYKPCGHRLLIELEQTKKKAGLIDLPPELVAKEQKGQDRAKVLAVGDTAFTDFGGEPWCKVGDTVLVARYGGWQIPGEGNDRLKVINDEDVAAVEVSDER